MAPRLTLTVGVEHWPLAKPFKISRGAKTEAVTVSVRVSDGVHSGQAEATPYPRYGETPGGVSDALWAVRDRLTDAPAALRRAIADWGLTGAARNALDCALWDLEAKAAGTRVAALAGVEPPPPVETAVTLSLDTAEAMADAARGAPSGVLKAKVGAGDVAEETARLRAIRAAAPRAKIIVDANEGWSAETLQKLDPICAEIGALFIEQPLPAEEDAALGALALTTPLCADESCHTAADLPRLAGLFQVVNIKLDKTGGLTEALALRAAARAAGFDVMIGCMAAGSLAMAPAHLLTGGALAVDLDGPLLLKRDREPPIRYEGGLMHPPEPALWG